jgi:hypothetical protein
VGLRNPVGSLPLSVDDALAVIRDQHRQQCEFDPEADPTANLSFATTIKEWRNACDLVGTKALGQALNTFWGTSFTAAQWKEVLVPPEGRTLGDVCRLVASTACTKAVRPAGYFGASCNAAGAFLAVRALLAEAGAPVSEVRPEAPLSAFSGRYPRVFIDGVSILSPGALPPIAVHSPARWLALLAVGLGLGTFVVGSALQNLTVIEVSGAAFLVLIAAALVARKVRPTHLRFGSLQTIRDLSEAIARAKAHT